MVGNKINEIKELERSLGLILKTFLLSNSESQANDTVYNLPGLITNSAQKLRSGSQISNLCAAIELRTASK